MNFYCTECGKLMDTIYVWGKKTFDRNTGRPIYTQIIIYQCPDFSEGYSDHYYQHHDRYERTEMVENINGLSTQPFLSIV